jgi:putative toxin-antitoxin system antitoxin component (TIGR02293 family)
VVEFKEKEISEMLLQEPDTIKYGLSDAQKISLTETLRNGLSWNTFLKFTESIPYNLAQWAKFLHVSERTLQRQKKDARAFQGLEAERIIEISLLFRHGNTVFGSAASFQQWLSLPCPALGNIQPANLLDSAFGIRLLREELIRIEHGIFA